MNKNSQRKVFYLLILISLFINFNINVAITSLKIFVYSENDSKIWVGEQRDIILKKYPENNDEKIYFKTLNNKVEMISDQKFFVKSTGRECISAFTKINKINETICFNLYSTPNIMFKEKNPVKIEVNHIQQLNLDTYDYPKYNIKYESNHQDIIKVNNEGKIKAIRPGRAIITAKGLDNTTTQINVLSITKEGLLKNYTLDFLNAFKYDNLMIVAHPDDEILWGGAHLFNGKYFVVCFTNGYTYNRARDFKKIIKFTKNGGIILNYPDLQDGEKDNWSEVEEGILKDLNYLLNYKNWKIIVTHGPDGTTGHLHHKKLSKFVSKIAKENNKLNNLYYFGKFLKKNEINGNLVRISDKEFSYKKREVSIYKSVKKTIHQVWFHFLPYENWISAVNFKKSHIKKNNTKFVI